jgi:hypothetical protein
MYRLVNTSFEWVVHIHDTVFLCFHQTFSRMSRHHMPTCELPTHEIYSILFFVESVHGNMASNGRGECNYRSSFQGWECLYRYIRRLQPTFQSSLMMLQFWNKKEVKSNVRRSILRACWTRRLNVSYFSCHLRVPIEPFDRFPWIFLHWKLNFLDAK